MKSTHPRLLTLLGLLATQLVAHAAGPLYLTGHPSNPQPLRWDTSQGPIKVYTDVGAFSKKNDGTVFLTDKQADAITAFSLKQWSSVATSTWRAETNPANFIKFTDVPSIGVDVHDADTAKLVYGQYNNGGFYVIYDVDGKVLEDYFGMPKDQVLGIALPEIAEDRDGDGYPETIVKATAVMNGWMVSHESPSATQRALPPADLTGARYAGVFTHEFGHALNLSHSQVNGTMAYLSLPGYGRDLYPGVAGCVAPQHHWLTGPNASHIDPKYIETMFPFIDPQNLARGRSAGLEMSTVDGADDIAAISNLYPTAAYLAQTGSIAGSLFLKDGHTGYSGINVVARNVANPLGDAVSAMTGDYTQGTLGPDGRFRINNLKPGQSYVLYLEEIVAGGYPTQPTMLMSQAEYWNAAESSDASTDTPCTRSTITAEAGVTKTANFYFNGHTDGVQYRFLTSGYLTSLNQDGTRAGGSIGADTPFVWRADEGATLLPTELNLSASGRNSISKDGNLMLVEANFDGVLHSDPYGGADFYIKELAFYNFRKESLLPLGALSATCSVGGNGGAISSYGWGINALGTAAVASSTHNNLDGTCAAYDWRTGMGMEVVPYLWTADKGGRALSLEGLEQSTLPWLRAAAVSGNGAVVVGQGNQENAFAWINEGKPIDLTALTGARTAEWVSQDGHRVPLATAAGLLMWNPSLGTGTAAFSNVSAPKFCTDFPLVTWDGLDHCKLEGAAWAEANFGLPAVNVNGISDDGRVVIARVGDFFSTFAGFMWVQDVGWIDLNSFLRKQGVVEALKYGLENPLAISGDGSALVGGLTGVQQTWHVDMKSTFVCRAGVSIATRFPVEFTAQVKAGAVIGRCENL